MSVARPLWFALLACLTCTPMVAQAAPLVPGTGQKVDQVGDDFEDTNWSFIHNFPKSSEELNENKYFPTGKSANNRWYEGIKRGQPDFMRQVPTPENGLAGSTGSLLIRTRNSGIPGTLTHQMQQDDLIVNCHAQFRGALPVAQNPNCVVRVYVPPFDKWEDRTGPSFGFRLALETHTYKVPDDKKDKRGLFGRMPSKQYLPETYWPGMFIHFRSKTDRRFQEDSAYFTIRSNVRGGDFKGPEITEPGWWTLGMSVTTDGKVHYYIHQGIEDLTADNYVTTQQPYGYTAELFKTFFFNVCNQDDGRTWSTPWIIDDPALYIAPGGGIAGRSGSNRR